MEVSELIIEKILNDNKFSMGLAGILGIQQQSVIGLAKRRSKNLRLYEAVLFYHEKGYTDEDIFKNYKSSLKEKSLV